MSYTDEELKQLVEEVATNYADLLILQYRACPKARATIKMFVEELLCNGLIFQYENILDLDTHFGFILDLIGKIVDCPRYIQGLTLTRDYFTFHNAGKTIGYSRISSPVNGSFKTIYNSLLSKYELNNSDYRQLIKFKILVNSLMASQKDIDDAIYTLFGNDIVLRNNFDLTITYIVANKLLLSLQAALKLRYFRAPCGVGFEYILVVPEPTKIYGFKQINSYKSPIGFSRVNAPKQASFLRVSNIVNINTV